MADISKLRANINGVFETFDVKDKLARENVENLSNALSAAQIVDSASGAIASFFRWCGRHSCPRCHIRVY